MELRQLRYFVRIVELGSMSRAALDLDMVQSALSQQVSRLESELSTRLLQRTPRGVRCSSRVDSSLSRRLTCWLSADWTMSRSRAARLMEPSSTMRTK